VDVHDIIIAYECSIQTGRLGCYYAASFVAHLLRRMPTGTWGFNNAQISLMKFGNGRSVKKETTDDDGKAIVRYSVHAAQVINPLTSRAASLTMALYMDVFKLWWGNPSYKLGFNNMGQLIKQAGDLITGLGRTNPDDVYHPVATGKIVMITRGERVRCTVAQSVALGVKKGGVHVQAVLFSTKAHGDSSFAALRGTVSYPPSINLLYGGAPTVLLDWGNRGAIAQSFLPTLCPGAVSPTKQLGNMCDKGVELLHRGRSCPNWKKSLGGGRLTLSECRNAAVEGGFEAFVYSHTAPEDTSENCYTHLVEKDGETDKENSMGMQDFKAADGVVRDDTCTHIPDFAKDLENKEEYKGWLNQPIAAGNGDLTHHYGVLKSKADCPALDQPLGRMNPGWDVRTKSYAQRTYMSDWSPPAYGGKWTKMEKKKAEGEKKRQKKKER